MCSCNRHLYPSSVFHHVLDLSLLQIRLFCPPESPSASGNAVSQLQTEKESSHTDSCLCFCLRLNPEVQTLLSIYSVFPATPLCWANFWDKEQRRRALTAFTLRREPPLLLAWFKSGSLMKLFKMCSWHFNTLCQFEFDYTLGWNWMAMMKFAFDNSDLVVFFWGLHEKSMKHRVTSNETIVCFGCMAMVL